jgi:sugar/nucleoside kinase (ribokinase family)
MFDVITIGTATLDVYLLSKFSRRIKDKFGSALCFGLGGKHEITNMHIDTGGGATNAAVTFSRHGFRTACLAKIGNDIPGELIFRDLEKEKITPLLIRAKSERTAYSTLLLTPEGERAILVYRGASEKMRASEIPWSKLKAKWVYFASGGIDLQLLTKLINFFHKQGTLIAINPGKAQLALGLKRLQPIIAKTKVFIVNREEASRLTKVPYANESQIFEKLDKAVGGILVVTDARRGSKVSDGYRIWHAGIFREKRLVDRTGAGDSFGSGFVAGLMEKGERCEKGECRPANIAYALRLASANATSNIEAIGAKSGILTKKEFQSRRWSHLAINVVK